MEELGEITFAQEFDQPAKKVWEVLTGREHMKNWFFSQIESFEARLNFETAFDVHFEGQTYRHLWKITELVPGKKMTINWRYAGIRGDSFVSFELFDNGSATTLQFRNWIVERFPEDNPVFSLKSAGEGWDFIIKKSLKEYLDK